MPALGDGTKLLRHRSDLVDPDIDFGEVRVVLVDPIHIRVERSIRPASLPVSQTLICPYRSPCVAMTFVATAERSQA